MGKKENLSATDRWQPIETAPKDGTNDWGLRREEPTIRLASCRSDGQCPECCRDWTERGVLSRLPLPPCGCHCCPDCGLGHTRALLTEALRQRDSRISAADLHAKIDRSFDDIRPLSDASGWSDPFDFLIHETWKRDPKVVTLIEERDAAIADRDRWWGKYNAAKVDEDVMAAQRDEAIRERDEARASRNTLILDLNCARAQATVVEEKAERAESEVKTLRLLVDSQTEQISRSAMDLYAAVQSEVAAEKRSEKAEEERDEAQAKLVEEREAMASISGELVQAQVKVAKERDSYRAALEECGELRSEARERAERADIERRQLRALLRECQDAVRIAASAEEDHGAINRARELDALSAKIKEVLG